MLGLTTTCPRYYSTCSCMRAHTHTHTLTYGAVPKQIYLADSWQDRVHLFGGSTTAAAPVP